ncbi:hypothetical protein [Actinokineospora sp.]|uniref:hypothetical protein n=1 Tax=Actinokineospora sp. TaxID=1872133 RepID=UPI003D6BD69D
MRKKLSTGIRVASGLAIGASMVLVGTSPASAALGKTETAAASCGYYHSSDGWVKYKNCSDNKYKVWVDTLDNKNEYWFCASAWSDRALGSTHYITWAHAFERC